MRDVRAILENVSRGGFVRGAAAANSLVVGMRILPVGYAAPRPAAPATNVPRFNPTAFIAIDSTGLVTIAAHRSAMGRGMRTGLPMVAADELDADWSRVHVSSAVGDEATYGEAASWGVAVTQVHARNHQIIHTATGRVLGYGEVVVVARALPVPQPETLKLKKRSEFRYVGMGLPIVDLDDMTTGRAGPPADRGPPLSFPTKGSTQ